MKITEVPISKLLFGKSKNVSSKPKHLTPKESVKKSHR